MDLIDRESLNRHVERLKQQGIEFEIIYRTPGESDEEGIRKIISNKFIIEQMLSIGRL